MKKKKDYKIQPESLKGTQREFLKKGVRADSHTGFKGVNFVHNRYYARIWTLKKNKVSIGGFATAKEAAKAYDNKMRETVGDWVYTNFKRNGVRNA